MQVIFKQEKFIQFTTGFKKIGTHAKNISCFSFLSTEVKLNKVDGSQVLNLLKMKLLKKENILYIALQGLLLQGLLLHLGAVHHPTRLTPLPPTPPQPTHLTPRPVRPTPRITTYTTNEVKVYSDKDDQDRTSQMMLPPTNHGISSEKTSQVSYYFIFCKKFYNFCIKLFL